MSSLRTSVSPTLYRVLHGSSNTTLRPIPRRREGEGFRLFHNPTLSACYIFKFPLFDDREARKAAASLGGDFGQGLRHIETGLYLPNDLDRPEQGGVAIYVGQRNFRQLMLEMMGLDADRETPEVKHDLCVLDALNELPSLDPFLLKLTFDMKGIRIAEGDLPIGEEETRAIRGTLVTRLGPVICKAFGASVTASAEAMIRLTREIWSPHNQEMLRFCSAFRIPPSEAPAVVFALQGMSFYEHLLNTTKDHLVPLARYLRDEAARPIDAARYPPNDVAGMETTRHECLTFLRSHMSNTALVFSSYDRAIEAFVKRDDPTPLIEFLQMARTFFWAVGHCATARVNGHAILADCKKRLRPPMTFTNVDATLRRVRAALAPRVPGL